MAANDQAVLSLDAILELLAHRHRRALIALFMEHDEKAIPVDVCIDQLVETDTELTSTHPGRDQIVELFHHIHLPKLAHAGIAELDTPSRTITYSPNAEVEAVLKAIMESSREVG